MENDILDVPATSIKGRRIQYETFKQWVTKKKKKIVSLRKQETDHTDSNMNSEQNEENPRTLHYKDDRDTKDVKHGVSQNQEDIYISHLTTREKLSVATTRNRTWNNQ